jgi:NADP-reducing hydrogenase subunit HndC
MPRPRPPFPAVSGLFGKPTLINNVETWANIPVIILDGGEWFSSIGTDQQGHQGLRPGRQGPQHRPRRGADGHDPPRDRLRHRRRHPRRQGVQGRPDRRPQRRLPAREYLDTQIDYESLAKAGSIMGSGGMIVIDEDSCMVDLAKFFLEFTQDESCGKCTPCREGTKRMLEILTRITEGKGKEGDIEKLERLGDMIKKASLCGLGQSAPNPVLSTIKNFRSEYEEHIHDKKCRRPVPGALLSYTVNDSASAAAPANASARSTPSKAPEKKNTPSTRQVYPLRSVLRRLQV